MSKSFKEIRYYDNGKIEVIDISSLDWNMAIMCLNGGGCHTIECREVDIKKATDKLHNYLRRCIVREQKDLDKRKKNIEKLNHPNIQKHLQK